MLIHQFLEDQAQLRGDQPALWFEGSWQTYAELLDRSQRIAGCLSEHGFKPGERAAILMENSADYVIFYFGILLAGGVVVGLNPGFAPEEIINLLKDCEASALFVDKKQMRTVRKTGLSDTNLRTVIKEVDALHFERAYECAWQEAFACHPAQKAARRIDLDLAEIVYTSGSTGKPKGVMLSHLNIVTNMHSIARYLELSEADRAMVILPFYYIYGKSVLLIHFLMGGSVVIDNRFMYPNKVIEAMAELQVTNFSGVPSTYNIMLSRSNIREVSLPSLRMVTQAGGAMAVSVQKEVAQVFAPAKLWVMYGATEAAPRLSYLHPDMLHSKSGSIGIAVNNVEIAIMDEDGKLLPANEKGEIVARGSNLMMGYWKDSEGTANAIREGYYHTGDLGYTDEEGFTFVVGRKNDIVKVKGFRVSTKEIEEKMMLNDVIEEVAVIGVDDPILGEALKAFVVLKPGKAGDEAAISSKLREHLADYKVPGSYEFISELPKNSSGKILKNLLKESTHVKS